MTHRLSQVGLESLLRVLNTNLRLSQVGLEFLTYVYNTKVRETQLAVEIILAEQRPLRLSQSALEVILRQPEVVAEDYTIYTVQLV